MSEASPDCLRASGPAPLRGELSAPGDKSISHRALILGALAEGWTRISGLLESADVLNTATAVAAFGAAVEPSEDGIWNVRGAHWRSPDGVVDCGNSGTGVRLLMGAAAGFPIEATFTGDESLRRRPMKRVTDPLREMGAGVEGGPLLPITIHGGALDGISFVNRHGSAQVKSAVLLAGLQGRRPIEVIEGRPSRDHTEVLLRRFGCDVEVARNDHGSLVRLGSRRMLTGTGIRVPGDPSSAAFLLVAALVTEGSDVVLRSVLDNPYRSGLFATLLEMGADLAITARRTEGGIAVFDIRARSSRLSGVTVPAARAPILIDEYPVLAIAAAFASGSTIMHGVSELRVKESDRLAAIVRGLKVNGVDAHADGDTLLVRGCGGPPAGGGEIATEGDHRIAMSFLVLGLGSNAPVTVDGSDMIATSFPAFVEAVHILGGDVSPCGLDCPMNAAGMSAAENRQ